MPEALSWRHHPRFTFFAMPSTPPPFQIASFSLRAVGVDVIEGGAACGAPVRGQSDQKENDYAFHPASSW
jgi:hypothetical protein